MNELKEYRKLSELTLWEKNPRGIKKDDFSRLKQQIKDLGIYKPLLVNQDNIVLGGNMRLRALKDLGFTDIWVSVVDAKDEATMLKYALSDNDRAGYYEDDKLAELIQEWGSQIDLDLYKVDLGKALTLADVLNQFSPDVEEDEAPEVSDEPPVSQIGEVYQLGKHRLMCGDSTKIEDVQTLMAGQQADMVFTDPPYNVDYVGKNKKALKIMNDKFDDESFYQFLLDAFTNMSVVTKGGGSIYVCHADMWGYTFRKAFIEAGYLLKQCIIWNKNAMVMGRQDYQWKHEPILYGWKDGGSHQWYGDRKQTTVWDINKPSSSDEHPTMKPITLVAKAIHNSSKQDDIVLDLFGGSGSTLIASEQLQRKGYLMELDPKYCDVIRKRYANFINKGEDWVQITPKITG